MSISKYVARAILFGSILVAPFVMGAPAVPANAAPFGLELGKATTVDVQKFAPKHDSTGMNDYSHGPQWETDGRESDIDGLTHVTYIFDQSNVLVAVIMEFPKEPVGMMKVLGAKYKLVSNRVNTFMNNGDARYEKGDSYIDIDAPHMSFEMHVIYATKGLMKAFGQTVSNDAARKNARKAQSM